MKEHRRWLEEYGWEPIKIGVCPNPRPKHFFSLHLEHTIQNMTGWPRGYYWYIQSIVFSTRNEDTIIIYT
jgi:hypothetical protein